MAQQTDVVERVKAWLAMRPDVTLQMFGAHTEMAMSTFTHTLNGSKAPSEFTRREMERVLRLAINGEIFAQGATPVVLSEDRSEPMRRLRRQRDFYVTATVRRIAQTLTFCADHAVIGIITAEYGVGKTEALTAWRRSKEGRERESVVLEFDEFSRGNRCDFVDQLATTLGVDHRTATHCGGDTMRRICAYLAEHPALVVFDQSELVSAGVMQVARQIWDRTRHAGVGMVFLGAPVLMERLKASRIQDLGALSSRVSVWVGLQGISAEEMAAVLKQEGIEVEDEVFRQWHRSVGGSMRRLVNSVDLVREKHVARGRKLTAAALEGVAGYLWGMQIGEAR